MDNRIHEHPLLGVLDAAQKITITVDGKEIEALQGEPIAAALIAAGIRVFRYTRKREEPRQIWCGIGRCTDCAMTVNGIPNVRTCVTAVEEGMQIETQRKLGSWPIEQNA